MTARWLTLIVLLIASITAAPGASARQIQTGTPVPFTGEAFIGLADDGITAVAVVIAGTDGEERDVRIYLCDGMERSAWLIGIHSGDKVEAASEDELTARATVDGDSIMGVVTGLGGDELGFTAERATGIAGLYDVIVGEDGTIRGTATDGRRLGGGVAATLSDGTLLMAVLIEEPEGGGRAVAVIASAGASGEQRWIVQADGRTVGSAKPRLGTGVVINHEEQYIDPVTDL